MIGRHGINLPASPWDIDAGWVFNPLCWSLTYTIGLAIGAGWLRTGTCTWLVSVSAAFLVGMSVATFEPFSPVLAMLGGPDQQDIRPIIAAITEKSTQYPLRILNAWAIIIIAGWVLGPGGAILRRAPALTQHILHPLLVIGRGSLLAFIASTPVALIGSIILIHLPEGSATMLLTAAFTTCLLYVVVKTVQALPASDPSKYPQRLHQTEARR